MFKNNKLPRVDLRAKICLQRLPDKSVICRFEAIYLTLQGSISCVQRCYPVSILVVSDNVIFVENVKQLNTR